MGQVRAGAFPVSGETVRADSDGSRWELISAQGEPDSWKQLEPPGNSMMEELEMLDDLEMAETDIATLGERRTALGAAFRVWRLAFLGAGVVRTDPPGPDVQPPAAIELIARAVMVDAIALVLDGAPLGVTAEATRQVRAHLGDPEMAFVQAELARMANEDSAPPGHPSHELLAAQKELQTMQSDLSPTSEARSIIAAVVNARGVFTVNDSLGNPVPRDLRDAPDALARALVFTDGVPIELARRAHAAAALLVANRLRVRP